MKKSLSAALMLIVSLLAAAAAFYFSCSAEDTPLSIVLDIKAAGEQEYYVTLLSGEENSYPGPAHLRTLVRNEEDEVYNIFVSYQDEEGFYFFGDLEKLAGNARYIQDFSAPAAFKILVYFPQSEVLAVSGAYSRYAQLSSYSVDLSLIATNWIDTSAIADEAVSRCYDYAPLLWAAVSSCILGGGTAVACALPLGYHDKKHKKLIFPLQLSVQILLAAALAVTYYFRGIAGFLMLFWAAVPILAAGEAAVFTFAFNGKKAVPGLVGRLPATYGVSSVFAAGAFSVTLALLIFS